MSKIPFPFNVRLEKTDRRLKTICAACGLDVNGITITDGDTLELSGNWNASRISAALNWGNCPFCGETLYFPELCILAESPPDADFSNDFCFEAERTEYYRVVAGLSQWMLFHYENVRDLNFGKYDPKTGNVSFFTGTCRWMDFHLFPAFAVPEGGNPWAFARTNLERLLPALLNLQWAEGQ
ncbi:MULTISPECIES: hypothetical protein [unclassified Nitrospina]|uniref:hypothetical protein n=1 Tax=unclassified Nitrospina TaxID=2638683 RepID=UPI003F9C1E1B